MEFEVFVELGFVGGWGVELIGGFGMAGAFGGAKGAGGGEGRPGRGTTVH